MLPVNGCSFRRQKCYSCSHDALTLFASPIPFSVYSKASSFDITHRYELVPVELPGVLLSILAIPVAGYFRTFVGLYRIDFILAKRHTHACKRHPAMGMTYSHCEYAVRGVTQQLLGDSNLLVQTRLVCTNKFACFAAGLFDLLLSWSTSFPRYISFWLTEARPKSRTNPNHDIKNDLGKLSIGGPLLLCLSGMIYVLHTRLHFQIRNILVSRLFPMGHFGGLPASQDGCDSQLAQKKSKNRAP